MSDDQTAAGATVLDYPNRGSLFWQNIGEAVAGEMAVSTAKAKLANEKPQGETLDYDKLIQAWREGRVK